MVAVTVSDPLPSSLSIAVTVIEYSVPSSRSVSVYIVSLSVMSSYMSLGQSVLEYEMMYSVAVTSLASVHDIVMVLSDVEETDNDENAPDKRYKVKTLQLSVKLTYH